MPFGLALAKGTSKRAWSGPVRSRKKISPAGEWNRTTPENLRRLSDWRFRFVRSLSDRTGAEKMFDEPGRKNVIVFVPGKYSVNPAGLFSRSTSVQHTPRNRTFASSQSAGTAEDSGD